MHICMYVCMYVDRQTWVSVCLYQSCMSFHVCFHEYVWLEMLGCMHLYLYAYAFIAIKNVIRSTGVHIFHIIGLFPWTTMPAILHIFVPLHYYCSLHIDCIYKQKEKLKLLFTMLLPYMCWWSIPVKCQIWKLVHVKIWSNCVRIYTSCELTAAKNVIRDTGIHKFNIINIYFWTNMPVILHLSVTLIVYYTLNIDSTLLHISVKQKTKCSFHLPCYCHIYALHKHAHQVPYIHHMSKLLNKHQWGKYVVYMPHTNSLACSAVHRRSWWWCNLIALAELAISQFSQNLWPVWHRHKHTDRQHFAIL